MNDIISRAQIYCMHKHAFQKRKLSKDPYWIHPVRVAGLVLEAVPNYRVNYSDLICAALLHDVIEDTDTTALELEQEFGDLITDLVVGLTNISKKEAPNANRAARKKLDKERMSKQSYNVKLIKYCDRYDNMRDCFDYVANWNIKQKLPESGWFFKYLNETEDFIGVLDIEKLKELFKPQFFVKYNLVKLLENFREDLELVLKGEKNG